jgi:DNA-directed RNA polymerase subunit RPC12/RpoP
MNVTFSCSRCGQGVRLAVEPSDREISCPACQQAIVVPPDAFDGPALCRCLVCPSTDLFVRKDFPQRLGVSIVVTGIVLSSVAWGFALPILTFAILFATALVDVVLYLIVPDALMCYRCGAQYRLAKDLSRHGAFNLETHERHRQQVARMAGQHR